MSDRMVSHPYIPNSQTQVQKEMMLDVGIDDIEELFSEIPEDLRYRCSMDLPPPVLSEEGLSRHMEGILSQNKTTKDYLSFLGAGCYQHYVPAICDEVACRSEFLTAYAGEPYEDHGRFQALFEYQSMMAELLDMDVVNVPTYDWCQAAATAVRMAGRITQRPVVLVAGNINPQRLAAIKNYADPVMKVEKVQYDPKTGCVDVPSLVARLTPSVAGVYLENPNYFGLLETTAQDIASETHKNGSLLLVGVDPITLGVLAPPSKYGADIVVGDIQTLGINMSYGGGVAGFIASCDKEEYVAEYPSRLFGIAKTDVEGEWGFGDVLYDRTSFAKREKGKEFVGTAAALWGITAGVYLALMGPLGMRTVGETIMRNSAYAAKKIADIKGIKVNGFEGHFFKEFAINFDRTGLTVAEINRELESRGILGGKDISEEFKELGQTALYCVTEIHTKDDILCLCEALEEIVCGLKGGGTR